MKHQVHEHVRRFLRRKNFTILLFLLLYLIAKLLLLAETRIGEFVPRELLILVSALPLIFLTFFFASLLSRVISPRISTFFKEELEVEQRIFFVKLFSILIYVAAIAFLLYSLGVPAASIVTFLGFVSAGLAFAVREPVLSFFTWIIILTKRPFRLGETIQIGKFEGKVDRIGTFYLTLAPARDTEDAIAVQDHAIKVPNKLLLDNYIENFGEGMLPQELRVQIHRFPKDSEDLLRRVRVIVTDVLERAGAGGEVKVFLDVKNEAPGDKQFVIVSYRAPIRQRANLRSAILVQLYAMEKTIKPR